MAFTEQHCSDPLEERYNTLTHGLGAVGALAVTVVMFQVAGGRPAAMAGAAAHGAALVGLLSCSTVYHGLQPGLWKDRMQLADHLFIYLFILGTTAPVAFVVMDAVPGLALLALQSAIAVVGITIKVRYGPHNYPLIGVALYAAAALAWVFWAGMIVDRLDMWGMIWFGIGGAAYAVGTVFFLWEALYFNHVIWHLFVVAGAASHAWVTVRYVLPYSGS
jgi:hemolysin III